MNCLEYFAVLEESTGYERFSVFTCGAQVWRAHSYEDVVPWTSRADTCAGVRDDCEKKLKRAVRGSVKIACRLVEPVDTEILWLAHACRGLDVPRRCLTVVTGSPTPAKKMWFASLGSRPLCRSSVRALAPRRPRQHL